MIRYAVEVLDGAPPAEVSAWLKRYGYSPSPRKVLAEVKAYRDSHRTNGITAASTQTAFAPVFLRDGRQSDNQATTVERDQRAPVVALACYAVAAVSVVVSLNTSWRFFDQVLHIPTAYGERWVMFGVAELALVVCGAGMAVNVKRTGRPGAFRGIVWVMCVAMGYMAWAMSTVDEAIGRIMLGPVLGVIMLHLGLGLELRARHQHTGTAARLARELRERCLSRLGLGDDRRDAAQRIRDRHARRAAALTRPPRSPWSRAARLERALLAAGVSNDEQMRGRLLAHLAVLRHAGELASVPSESPWNRSQQ
ncbi:hypothetical protein [Mycolicibacterium fortuitum]|uniref:DUF2637 domain-containing protein n=2 Tax=Mycolicibacterium fortuitum TaxID=1766 RepID=A0AAE4VDQ1_MYCFO|nr:hypothetical protein [Mycolicibacterium fortuitum]MDV7193366.1 hypothetical protein [Mycolicibacterium fortuitum]MDV7205953.1 hypothetical protein [Mycolicibacterium fortuitum]MDV7227366.1 hypothetical protein [Mycolicibacterium fortuitum]MDV7259937.1 hypothetical protein [Mycolicibacterium fortuitum]MDV7287559.1 hypothetical protein [Mycolicibacterium fortuitum]